MKFKILAGLALTTVALAACKVDIVDDGLGGLGGSGDTVTSTTGGTKTTATTTTTTTTTASTTNVTVTNSTTGSGMACSDEAVCDDCIQCAANDACSAQFDACPQGSDCLTLNQCLVDCNDVMDNPATADDEHNQCICGVNDLQADCDLNAPPGGCYMMHSAGIPALYDLLDCIFGMDGMSGECGTVADCG